jgi:hypothetical protein
MACYLEANVINPTLACPFEAAAAVAAADPLSGMRPAHIPERASSLLGAHSDKSKPNPERAAAADAGLITLTNYTNTRAPKKISSLLGRFCDQLHSKHTSKFIH